MYMTASPMVLTTRAPREVTTLRAVVSKSSSMVDSSMRPMVWARWVKETMSTKPRQRLSGNRSGPASSRPRLATSDSVRPRRAARWRRHT